VGHVEDELGLMYRNIIDCGTWIILNYSSSKSDSIKRIICSY